MQATHDLTGSGTTVEYEVILEKTTEFGHKLNTGEQRGLAAESSGSLDFINSGNYWADKYDKLIWENRDVKVYSWGRDVDVTNARQIFNGKIQSKSYSNKGVSFKLADFAFKLREQPVIANYTQADGDIPDSVIGKPKRRIYGRAEVLAQPLDMILDGYDMDGTFTITSGNATVTTSVDQRGKVFQGDEVTFNGSEFKIDTATASTLVLTEAPDFSLSNTTGTVKPHIIQVEIEVFSNSTRKCRARYNCSTNNQFNYYRGCRYNRFFLLAIIFILVAPARRPLLAELAETY